MEHWVRVLNRMMPGDVHIDPAALADLAWRSIPGALAGVIVASLLLFIRSTAEGMRQPEVPNKLSSLLKWPIYLLHVVQAWYILALGVVLALQAMPLGREVHHFVRLVFTALTILQLGMVLTAFVKDGAHGYLRRSKADGGRVLLVNMLVTAGTLLVWALMLLMGLNAFGVNVTALLAGLGLGGIAIAFATKNLFENILASFAIVLDPPFVIGDAIQSGDVSGTVERITLKSVLIRTYSGEQVVVPNAELLNGRIRNFTRMNQRQVVISFGLAHTAASAELAKVPALVQKAVEKEGGKNVKFARCHLTAFQESAFMFEVLYFVLSTDFNLHMDIRQAVLLDIYRGLEKMKVRLAVPTQLAILPEDGALPPRLAKAKAK